MTGTKHTPGPWALHVGNDYIRIEAENSEIWVLGETLWNVGNEEDMANAQLIAAAPDLLEAAQAVSEFQSIGNLAKLNAAIAKAKGSIA